MKIKSFLLSLSLFAAISAHAQEAKYSVATNSFFNNWESQIGVQYSDEYPGFSLALAKWFTPGLGLRGNFHGLWGSSKVDTYDWTTIYNPTTGQTSTYKGDHKHVFQHQWTANLDILFNFNSLFKGYNENRVYSFIPFVGAGVGRNCTQNAYAMDLSIGLLNQIRLNDKLTLNIEGGINHYEKRFYGRQNFTHYPNKGYAEIGLTIKIGKSGFKRVPDAEAIRNELQTEIDALKAQLEDEQAENERLLKGNNAEEEEPAEPAETE